MRHRRSLLLPALVLVVGMAASAGFAQSTSALSWDLGLEATTLTDFKSYFSLPVGARIGIDCRLVTFAPGLSFSAGGTAGWWMESFRDTFRFQPEVVPVMVPVTSVVGLRWEPIPAFGLGVNAELGVVVEWVPGAPPALLLCLSPGLDIRWYFARRVGVATRLGWVWVGADPIWNGPTVKIGPIFR